MFVGRSSDFRFICRQCCALFFLPWLASFLGCSSSSPSARPDAGTIATNRTNAPDFSPKIAEASNAPDPAHDFAEYSSDAERSAWVNLSIPLPQASPRIVAQKSIVAPAAPVSPVSVVPTDSLSEDLLSSSVAAIEEADEELSESPSPHGAEFSLASTASAVGKDPPSDGFVAAANDRVAIPIGKAEDEKDANIRQQPLVVATEEEKNQKIAPDWPQPWATLFLTGQQLGYIEPCGCTGLENQKGGLNRRDTLLQSLRDRNFNVIPLDVGNQEKRSGRQAHLKYMKSIEALRDLGYQAITFGLEDLKLAPIDLVYAMSDVRGGGNPFVSANVGIFGSPLNSVRIIQVGERRIGVTAVLSDTLRGLIKSQDIQSSEALAALRQATEKLKAENCDYLVLLAQASLEDTTALAQAVPDFDLVVTAGGLGEPTYRPEPIEGTKSVMVQVGVKGMYVSILGLFDDPQHPIRYQRIALSSQFTDSPRMMDLLANYQEALQQMGFDGLGLRPLLHPSTREFVGSESCGDCHSKAYAIWKDTPHAHATESIVHPPDRGSIARHFDPECVSCHVTGWHAQEFQPYISGYQSLELTPHLVGSGCENCHGPGSAHVAAENGEIEADDAMLAKLREEMRLPLMKAEERCLQCHDMDNSPSFHEEGAFQKYWDRVKHYGKD